jgi:hypothetical protein
VSAPATGPTASDAELLRVMLADLADRQVTVLASLRTWRKFTLTLAVVLLVVLPLFALLAPHLGGSLITIRHEVAAAGSPTVVDRLSSGDLAQIELWGALGGTVGIIAALGRIPISISPSSLQVAQLILKPIAGAAVALLGVVLTQGGIFNQIQPVSTGAIAAYAGLFGFGQEFLTRLLDKRASSLVATATPKAA